MEDSVEIVIEKLLNVTKDNVLKVHVFPEGHLLFLQFYFSVSWLLHLHSGLQ